MKSLAVLAHIDAGKTTLSERLLFLGRRIDVMGEVDEGLSTLDYLPEERRRGITIEAGYSDVTWKDQHIQLIDTPGHLDFGVEVDAALSAVEGAVLVISAVRGIQTQTLNHWHKLQEKKIPTLLFVNKMDMPGAVGEDLILAIEEALGVDPLVLSLPSGEGGSLDGVIDLLQSVHVSPKGVDRRDVNQRSLTPSESDWVQAYLKDLWLSAGDFDDEVLEAVLEERIPSLESLLRALAQVVAARKRTVLLYGSAKQNIGVRQLMNAIRYFLPSFQSESLGKPAVGQIVKARWRKDLGQYYLFKSFSDFNPEALGQSWRLHAEELEEMGLLRAGELCALCATQTWEMGDHIDAQGQVVGKAWTFDYRPLLQSRLEVSLDDLPMLSPALDAIAKTDPSLWARMDSETGQWIVSTVGEVYLEVLQARLRDEFGLNVICGAPEVRCLERWVQSVDLHEKIEMPQGGVEIELSLRSMDEDGFEVFVAGNDPLPEWTQAVCESVLGDWIRKGLLGRGEIVGLRAIVHGIRWFGQALPGLLAKALNDMLTWKLSSEMVRAEVPWLAVEIQLPWDSAGNIMEWIQARGGEVRSQDVRGAWMLLNVEMTMESTFGLSTELRSLSHGQASWTARYAGHRG